jgi:uncharacterized membrane protein YqjE
VSRSSADMNYDPATQPLRPELSLGELFGEMTTDLSTLMRKEIELAKVEAKEEMAQAGKGVGMFAGAGLAAWLALVFLSFGLAWLLDQALNRALAFAIVGVLWAIVGAVLALRGKAEIKKVEPLPTTVQTVKEDVEWAKEQKS